MSRGLGSTQRKVLDFLRRGTGPTVQELKEYLNCSERYAQRLVTTLEDRRLVIVTTDDEHGIDGDSEPPRRFVPKGLRRVWLPDQAWKWRMAKWRRDRLTEWVRETAHGLDNGGVCPACGQARPKRQRPV